MKLIFSFLLFAYAFVAYSQTDYSSNWKDLFSYNEIVDVVKSSSKVYALTDNAVFIYNMDTEEVRKLSSVNGLSGKKTSCIYYNEETELIIIGYESGLLEIIDKNNKIFSVVDIELSDVSLIKRINALYVYENMLYCSVSFGVMEYDLIDLEFGDLYRNATDSSSEAVPFEDVQGVVVVADKMYAVADDGLYSSSFVNGSPSRIWNKQDENLAFSNITSINGEVFVSKGKELYQVSEDEQGNINLIEKADTTNDIIDLYSMDNEIYIVSSNELLIYDVVEDSKEKLSYPNDQITSIAADESHVYLGSNSKGVLKRSKFSIYSDLKEIKPNGPLQNNLFSITVNNSDVWCVYGIYDGSKLEGVSHFNGEAWVNINYADSNGVNFAEDLVHVTVDPENFEKVYISSSASGGLSGYGTTKNGGILILENNSFSEFWNPVNTNGGLNSIIKDSGFNACRTYGSAFDSKGDLWIANGSLVDSSGELRRYSDGVWTKFNLFGDIGNERFLYDLVIGKDGNIYICSLRDGLFVFNEDEAKTANLTTSSGDGSLPSSKVLSVAVGVDNNIWIGTDNGLRLFSDVENVFGDFTDVQSVIIDTPDGASELLGDAKINDIKIDGIGNVWFATDNLGVIKTNSTGKKVLLSFDKSNSPLPSNQVLSIGIDDSSGDVYFGTGNGIISYKGDVLPYGESLSQIYAYPNPALKIHSEISIVGKDSNLPEGTNMKIFDVSMNLVFESNALATQSEFGGKFLWDKRNLQGEEVASGVYIVITYNADGAETSSTKIAIVN